MRHLNSITIRAAALVLSVLALSACAINPVTGQRELMLISESREIEIGREAAPSMKWSFGGEFKDPEIKKYLEDIVRRLWDNSERPHLPLTFYVQNTSVPNAFALPGHVAITRGLLAELENEAQFAAIMGHEMGHVMARHTAKRLTQTSLMQIGLIAGGAAISGSGGDIFTQAGAIGGTLLLLKFSRNQELQADRLGARYMSVLGYDPSEAITAHERLQVAVNNYIKRTGGDRREDSPIGTLLSTHPRHEVRKEEIRAMIDALPPYWLEGDGKHRERFLEKTRRLREVNRDYYPYDKAEKLYSEDKLHEAGEALTEAIGNNPGQPSFYNLLGMIKIKQERPGEAGRHFDMALSIDPEFQPSIFGRGVVLHMQEKYRQALSEFEHSLKLYPEHLGSLYGMGAGYFELRRYQQAVPYLRQVAAAVPRHPEIHGMMGISYEGVGDVNSAINEYRAQLQVSPQNEYGRYASARLAVLVPVQQLSPQS